MPIVLGRGGIRVRYHPVLLGRLERSGGNSGSLFFCGKGEQMITDQLTPLCIGMHCALLELQQLKTNRVEIKFGSANILEPPPEH